MVAVGLRRESQLKCRHGVSTPILWCYVTFFIPVQRRQRLICDSKLQILSQRLSDIAPARSSRPTAHCGCCRRLPQKHCLLLHRWHMAAHQKIPFRDSSQPRLAVHVPAAEWWARETLVQSGSVCGGVRAALKHNCGYCLPWGGQQGQQTGFSVERHQSFRVTSMPHNTTAPMMLYQYVKCDGLMLRH